MASTGRRSGRTHCASLSSQNNLRRSYAAIRFVLRNLHDVSAFFLEPHGPMEVGELGINALYPDGTVVFVQPHSPAAQAGVRGGDMLETIDGEPLRPQGGEAPPAGYPGTWFVD